MTGGNPSSVASACDRKVTNQNFDGDVRLEPVLVVREMASTEAFTNARTKIVAGGLAAMMALAPVGPVWAQDAKSDNTALGSFSQEVDRRGAIIESRKGNGYLVIWYNSKYEGEAKEAIIGLKMDGKKNVIALPGFKEDGLMVIGNGSTLPHLFSAYDAHRGFLLSEARFHAERRNIK